MSEKESYSDKGTPFKLNCVILTKAQLQVWVDKGWTNPASQNKIKRLLFQHYSANAAKAASNMQIITYPLTGKMEVEMSGKTLLGIDDKSVPKTISGELVLANNSIDFDDLKITKADGTLNDFDFIRLRPAQKFPPYINFEVEIVRNGILDLTTKGRDTNPCPPYCPPPDWYDKEG